MVRSNAVLLIPCLLQIVLVDSLIKPPNIEAVQYGFNLLLGRTPEEQRSDLLGGKLFEMTHSGGDGIGGYFQYEQVSDMSTGEDCKWEGVSNTVSYSLSSKTLESQSLSSSDGYDQQTSIGVDVPGVGSVETNVRNALIFSNSQTSFKQSAEMESGFEFTFDGTARRSIYAVEIAYEDFGYSDWATELRSACATLGENPSMNSIAGFIQQIGSHGLKKAGMGQMCTTSAFMRSGETMTSYYEYNTEVRQNQQSFLWWTSTSSNSETDGKESESSTGVTYTHANKYCRGSLKTDSSCGEGMKGNMDHDAPAIVKWTYMPIWEMNIPQLSTGAKRAMENFFHMVMQGAVDCRMNFCNNHGSCGMKKQVWYDQKSAMAAASDVANFFDPSKCFCDDTHIGSSCAIGRPIAVGMPVFPENYQNDYDGWSEVTATTSSGERGAFCGTESIHNWYYEDRKFKLAVCSLEEKEYKKPVGAIRKLEQTLRDEKWTRECNNNEVMVYEYSSHSDRPEDRWFILGCQAIQNVQHYKCAWDIHWVNEYDKYFKYSCENGTVMTGVQSVHSDHYEDRRFKFKCCQLQAVDDAVEQAAAYMQTDTPHEMSKRRKANARARTMKAMSNPTKEVCSADDETCDV